MRYKISSGKYIPDKEQVPFCAALLCGCLTCFWLEKGPSIGREVVHKAVSTLWRISGLSKKIAQGNDAERCRQEKEIQSQK